MPISEPTKQTASASVAALALAGILSALAVTPAWGGNADPGWSDLVRIDEEAAALARPARENGLPRASRADFDARSQRILELGRRLQAIDTAGWSVAGQIDRMLVGARLDGLSFEHGTTRPWERDPIYHLDFVRRIPYVDLPLSENEATGWRQSLAAVPATLAQARETLVEPSGELARQAIFHLERFDGVGQGEPYRDDPPAGTIGWYEDLCARIEARSTGDEAACRAALDAVVGYRDWLAEELPRMAPSAGIGEQALRYYFCRVRLLPYTPAEIRLLGEREYHRYRAAYEIARNRNRDLPELELTQSAAQHEHRTRQAEEAIRVLVATQSLMTFPDDTPETFATDTFWSPRALDDRHFWEEIQFRNALNNHIHASVPGHRFDGLQARKVENPIRRRYRDSTRAEGWATYLEEMFLLAGLTRDVPRADELFYAALMKRATRIWAETEMHSDEMTLAEANRYMIDYVPYMEQDLGRYDLEGYLRRPGSGSGYILGKIQLEKLLSERALALGDGFDLGSFHDEILAGGMIPFALLRWETTGAWDEIVDIRTCMLHPDAAQKMRESLERRFVAADADDDR